MVCVTTFNATLATQDDEDGRASKMPYIMDHGCGRKQTDGFPKGVGGGCAYTAAMVVIGFNFSRWKSVAGGIAISGMGIGQFAMSPILVFSRQNYGTVGCFIILAAAVAHYITCGTLCFPSELEINAQVSKKRNEMDVSDGKTKSMTCVSSLKTYKPVISNKAVVCLCFSMLNYSIGTFFVYLHIPSYILSEGFTPTDVAYIMSIMGISTLVGRILAGAVANWKRVHEIWIYSGSMAVVSVATYLYPKFNDTLTGQIAYAVVFGLFFGNCYALAVPVNVRFVGVKFMAFAIGLQYFFGGIGALVGPVLAGYIIDTGGTYGQSFTVAACAILIATVSSAVTIFLAENGCLSRCKAVSSESKFPALQMDIVIEAGSSSDAC